MKIKKINPKKIVFTGGGTAGHVTPNIILSKELKNDFPIQHYIGSKNGIEKSICENEIKIPYHKITTCKFTRRKILKNLLIPFQLLKGKHEALRILKSIKPDVIFSKGGYVSVPVVLAAKKLRIPIIIHESDFSVGLANRICSKCSNFTFTTFKNTAKTIKNGIFSGPPTKKLDITKEEARLKIGVKTKKPVLIIAGGSIGARAINSEIEKHLPVLIKKYEIFHHLGKNNTSGFSHPDYHSFEFRPDIQLIFLASDYAITRGGSNTIWELAFARTPMIIIPLPKGNSRGDQEENAKEFEDNGLSITLYQKDLNLQAIINKLNYLQNNKERIRTAQEKYTNTNAIKTITDSIIEIAK